MQLVYFTAPWCQPCRVFGPEMEKVSETIPVTKVDISEDPTQVDKYGIMSVPTVVLFDGNREVSRFVGARTKDMVLDWVKEVN